MRNAGNPLVFMDLRHDSQLIGLCRRCLETAKDNIMAKNQLTPRETEVVRLVSLGCSLHDAAWILDISANTVDNHRTRAMKKLGVDKAALLTRVAIKKKITTINDKLTPEEMELSGRCDDGWNVSADSE